MSQTQEFEENDSDDGGTRLSCGSCRFWKPHAGIKEANGWGQCKRMPPALPEVKDEKLVLAGIWPSTDERDWCGEWEARSNECGNISGQ
ncbi:MAG: hypothetical protein ABGW78_01780 [Pirellulales bacterium]